MAPARPAPFPFLKADILLEFAVWERPPLSASFSLFDYETFFINLPWVTPAPSTPLPLDKKIIFFEFCLWATPPIPTPVPFLDNEVPCGYAVRTMSPLTAYVFFFNNQIVFDFSSWSMAPITMSLSLLNDKIVLYLSWMPPASPTPLAFFDNKIFIHDFPRTMSAPRSRGRRVGFIVISTLGR
jgi:hypothetical protein